MHSSRMRTVRSSGCISGVYLVRGVPGPRGVYLVWGVYLVPGEVPGPRGCTWVWGVYLVPGGVPGQGVYLVLGGIPGLGGGVPGLGSVPGQGVSALGVYLVRYSPPVDRQNACKKHNHRNFVADGNNKKTTAFQYDAYCPLANRTCCGGFH